MLAKCIISVIDLYNICSRLLRQTTVLTKYVLQKRLGTTVVQGSIVYEHWAMETEALLTANLHSYFTNGETQYLSHIGALVKCTCSPHSKH